MGQPHGSPMIVEAPRQMIKPASHVTMARRYSDWARQQADLADRSLNPKVRQDHLALADFYLQLANEEVAAANSLDLKAA